MDVDVIAFTGSTEVGKYFLKYSGESNMKQVWLECGGKSPNIVLGDAPNLDVAAQRTAFGIWFNQGEVCTAGSRLIVEDSIKDEFLEKVMAIGQQDDAWRPARPQDPDGRHGRRGPRPGASWAISTPARRKAPGSPWAASRCMSTTPAPSSSPTVFDNVDNKMKIAQEEIFGPVLLGHPGQGSRAGAERRQRHDLRA
jgi:acyl-CoA reductase-like NAD-dependent aldehyde dehydrogenase